MSQRNKLWMTMTAFLLAAVLGCQRPAEEEKIKLPPRNKTAKKMETPAREEAAPKTAREEPGEPPRGEEKTVAADAAAEAGKPEAAETLSPSAIPKVVLGEANLAASLVKVGDKMPDAELPDLGGKNQPLHALQGEKLTVVFFWSADGLAGLQELRDLGPNVAEPYGGDGVRVVGVNVRNSPEEVKTKVEQAGAEFPILLDREGALLAKMTSDQEKLPRTYLLDAAGKVLWFDVVYSRGTREELLQAIRAVLGK